MADSRPGDKVDEAKRRLRRAIKLFHNADEHWGSEMIAEFEDGAPKDMTLLEWIDAGIESCAAPSAERTITVQPIVHNNHEWPSLCADVTGMSAIRWKAADGSYRWMLWAEAVSGKTVSVPSATRDSDLLEAVRGWVQARAYGSPETVLAAEWKLNETFRKVRGLSNDIDTIARAESAAKGGESG